MLVSFVLALRGGLEAALIVGFILGTSIIYWMKNPPWVHC
jgi:high-affinity Fe2+/Pb2+ permease